MMVLRMPIFVHSTSLVINSCCCILGIGKRQTSIIHDSTIFIQLSNTLSGSTNVRQSNLERSTKSIQFWRGCFEASYATFEGFGFSLENNRCQTSSLGASSFMVYMVVGDSVPLSVGDTITRDQLRYTLERLHRPAQVHVVQDIQANPSKAALQNYSLVYLAPSVTISNLKAGFREVDIPVVIANPGLLVPDLCGSVQITSAVGTSIRVEVGHPIVSNHSGIVQVYKQVCASPSKRHHCVKFVGNSNLGTER